MGAGSRPVRRRFREPSVAPWTPRASLSVATAIRRRVHESVCLVDGTSVSEIHRYPLRPAGFEEPLFPTATSRRAIAEHLAHSSWLFRAPELAADPGLASGEAVHRRREIVHLFRRDDGWAYLVRRCGRRTTKRRIVRMLESWREVGRWWEGEDSVDRLVYRVLLEGGAVVDLALEKSSSEWLLVGVVD
jgi:hypothetical protein